MHTMLNEKDKDRVNLLCEIDFFVLMIEMMMIFNGASWEDLYLFLEIN